MAVELFHRGRFHPLPGATSRKVGPNAYEVRIPRTDESKKVSRREHTAEAWDDAVFAIDGVQTEPGLGSGETDAYVAVTVLVLG